jgi:hypothetical protein
MSLLTTMKDWCGQCDGYREQAVFLAGCLRSRTPHSHQRCTSCTTVVCSRARA